MHFNDETVVDVICDNESKNIIEDIMGVVPVKKMFDMVDKIRQDIKNNIKLVVENYVDVKNFKPPIEISKKFQDLSDENKIQIDSSSEEYANLDENNFKCKIKNILEDLESLGTGIIIDCLKSFLGKFMEVGYSKLTCGFTQKEFKFGLISKNGDNYKFLIFSFLYDKIESNHNLNLIFKLGKSNDKIQYSHFYSTFTIAKRQLCRYLESIYKDYYNNMQNGDKIEDRIFELADTLFYHLYMKNITPEDSKYYIDLT